MYNTNLLYIKSYLCMSKNELNRPGDSSLLFYLLYIYIYIDSHI